MKKLFVITDVAVIDASANDSNHEYNIDDGHLRIWHSGTCVGVFPPGVWKLVTTNPKAFREMGEYEIKETFK